MKVLFLFYMFVLFSGLACAQEPDKPRSREFSAVVSDGTTLNGQIDLPIDDVKTAVLLIPGSGGHSRDYAFGENNDGVYLFFERLSDYLTKRGIAVVRYDERGFGDLRKGSIDNERLIGTIGQMTKSDDLVAIVIEARRLLEIPQSCFIGVPHSEGMLTIGRAISPARQLFGSILGISPLMESPSSAMYWQMVARPIQSLYDLDKNGDQLISREELRQGWASTAYHRMQPPLHLFDSNEVILAERLKGITVAASRLYERTKIEAINTSDAKPFILKGKLTANYGWWKQWFTDKKSVASRLKSFNGPLKIIYGLKDGQLDVRKQIELAETELELAKVAIRKLPDLGHSLGTDPSLGPVAKQGIDSIGAAISELSNHCT